MERKGLQGPWGIKGVDLVRHIKMRRPPDNTPPTHTHTTTTPPPPENLPGNPPRPHRQEVLGPAPETSPRSFHLRKRPVNHRRPHPQGSHRPYPGNVPMSSQTVGNILYIFGNPRGRPRKPGSQLREPAETSLLIKSVPLSPSNQLFCSFVLVLID